VEENFMRSLQNLALATIGLLAVAACAPPAGDAAADVATMSNGTKAWVDAYNAGDAGKIVALYADDAVLMPPDAPVASSHEAMRSFISANIADSKASGVTFVLGAESTGVSGNLGWHSGTFKGIGAGGATVGTGKYLEIWRKKDGKWLIVQDIWNNDAPAAAPPTK
jgi:ketosteroid isomerase-like protein